MALSLSDLKAHEAELLRQREHIDKELDALKYLIEGLAQRSGTIVSSSLGETKKQYRKSSNSFSNDVREAIEEMNGSEFSTGEVAGSIIQKGIRKENERKQLRNIAYTILKDLVNKGKVKRENRGDNNNPDWIYQKIAEGKLFEN